MIKLNKKNDEEYEVMMRRLKVLKAGDLDMFYFMLLLDSIMDLDKQEGFIDVVPNLYRTNDLQEEVLGEVKAFDKDDTILLNKKFLEECLNNKVSFADVLEVIGHENTHLEQRKVFDKLSGNTKASRKEKEELSNLKAEKLQEITSLGKQYLEADTVRVMFDLLGNMFEKDYMDAVHELTESEKQEVCKDISFSQYLQLKHEEQARTGGLRFARRNLERIYEIAKLKGEDEICEWIKEQQAINERAFNEELIYNKHYYKWYDTFKSNLKNVDFNVFNDLERMILDPSQRSSLIKGWDKYTESEMCNALVDLGQIYFQEKPVNELIGYYYKSMRTGNILVHKCLRDILFKVKRLNPKQIEEIAINEAVILLTEKLSGDFYDASLANYLEPRIFKDMIKNLIDEDRLACALPIISNYVFSYRPKNVIMKKIDEDVQKVLVSSLDNISDYLNRIENKVEQDPASVIMDDIFELEKFLDFGISGGLIVYKSVVKSEKIKQQVKTLKDRCTKLILKIKQRDKNRLNKLSEKELWNDKNPSHDQTKLKTKVYGEKFVELEKRKNKTIGTIKEESIENA